MSTKEQIITEARNIIFFKKEKLTFRKLSNNLGISLGSINYYFPNQNDLYSAVLKQNANKLDSSSFTNAILSLIKIVGDFDLIKSQLFNSTVISTILNYIWDVKIYEFEDLFIKEFDFKNRQCIVNILTKIQMSLLVKQKLIAFLDKDLNDSDTIKQYITDIIIQEVHYFKNV